jgi:hypothetical protein
MFSHFYVPEISDIARQPFENSHGIRLIAALTFLTIRSASTATTKYKQTFVSKKNAMEQ